MTLQDAEQRRLRAVPSLDVTDELFGAGAETEMVLEVEDAQELRLDLVLADEDVGVVLLELADPEQAMERPRPLEPVQRIDVRVAERKLTVAVPLQLVDDMGVGAVHRLEAVGGALVHRNPEHVVAEVVPVPGGLPQPLLADERRHDLLVAAGSVVATPEVEQLVEHD